MSGSDDLTVVELWGEAGPRDTRERLLFTSLNLFKEYGFHAVGLDRILTEVGVTKTTFYNHFESKYELAVEAVRLRDKWETDSFFKAVQERASFDPKKMLLVCFDVLDEWFNGLDYRGCLFIHACAEFPNANDPIHKAGAAHYLEAQKGFERISRGAGIQDAEELAREWVMLLEAAVLHRLISKDDGAAQVSKRIAEQRLAHYLTESSS